VAARKEQPKQQRFGEKNGTNQEKAPAVLLPPASLPCGVPGLGTALAVWYNKPEFLLCLGKSRVTPLGSGELGTTGAFQVAAPAQKAEAALCCLEKMSVSLLFPKETLFRFPNPP